MRHICTLSLCARLGSRPRPRSDEGKNMVQMRHICTIFFLHDESYGASQKLLNPLAGIVVRVRAGTLAVALEALS